ncbi:hypothetical protein EYZ11_000853 [Aspergillus tanneri]|uniref:Uncharacterized protein n=1 Tax=Aspergillus tanneri TaxID=1220188 RepID=A0A4S3JW54_9EURO|nr:hypothetical protein EYZ11_000853 [Aspergillus tanneri]
MLVYRTISDADYHQDGPVGVDPE